MGGYTVLVNGLGNIGTILVNVLCEYQKQLNIQRLIAYKNCPQPWQQPALEALAQRGIEVVVASDFAGFPQRSYRQALRQVDYVFETREHGYAMAEKANYQSLIADTAACLRAVCAQGSEKKFGIPYMAGLDATTISKQPFATVVSCNTHALTVVLRTFCGQRLECLDHADAAVVRRSEDLGSNGRLVAANIVARHLDEKLGTHHAIDAVDLFASLGVAADITSSDITTPSQAMHALRFNICFSKEMALEELQQRLVSNPYIATTNTFDSGEIMAAGRRYGLQGRIYSQAVVVANQLLLKRNTLRGWAFVPQEACTIISSVAAYCHQMNLPLQGLQQMEQALLQPTW